MAETIVMASGLSMHTDHSLSERPTFDLWSFDVLDLELTILAINGTGELWATVILETSMEPKEKAKWTPLGVFTPMPAGGRDTRRFTGFLRYVRLHVTSNAEESVTVTFNLRGMAR